MNLVKKIASLMLALAILFSLAMPALAAEKTGTITISNAVKDQDYAAYRIFDLISYDATNKFYSYKLNSAWAGFIAADYFTVNADGYIEWVDSKNNEDGAKEFVKVALAYAKGNPGVAADDTKTATENGTLTFDSLPLGYYLIDSSLGALCSIDTLSPDATIQEKNSAPTNEKTVKEDSTGIYGTTNDDDITQTVSFQSTITAGKGASNYVFHDKMSEGLSFGSVTDITLNDTSVNSADYTVVSTGLTDACTFEITFTTDFCAALKENDKIVISYTATFNDKAVIGSSGNPNESKVKYGDENNTSTTPPSETVTKTWGVDLFKYTGTEKTSLAGAEFVLYKQVTDTKQYATVENGKLASWVDNEETATKLTSGSDGIISVDGLDSDTYWFKETAAPAGYNLLKDPIQFTIDNTGTIKMDETTVTRVEVENNAGSELPSTGGMGTTLFYTIGGLLMLAAVVLLVVKKRMGSAE